MSVESDVQAAPAEAPPAAPAGNPALLGLPTFLPAGITLGLWFVGYLPADLPGGMVAASVASAGLFLLIATVWAARLGASAVAGIFGTFSAFWLSLGLMLMGLNNGWFGLTDAAQVGSVLTPYVLAWLIVFVALTLATLRLPLAFTIGFVLVSATFALLLVNLLTGAAVYSTLAGLTTFAFCAVYAYIFFDAMGQELGGKAMPMGSALVK